MRRNRGSVERQAVDAETPPNATKNDVGDTAAAWVYFAHREASNERINHSGKPAAWPGAWPGGGVDAPRPVHSGQGAGGHRGRQPECLRPHLPRRARQPVRRARLAPADRRDKSRRFPQAQNQPEQVRRHRRHRVDAGRPFCRGRGGARQYRPHRARAQGRRRQLEKSKKAKSRHQGQHHQRP